MLKIDESLIRNTVGKVFDPDLNKSLDELDAIENIVIDSDKIKINLRLVQPVYWIAEALNKACLSALKDTGFDGEAEIFVSEIHKSDPSRNILKDVKNIVAVASGKGGVGKSSIASNIAAALSLKGAKVGILDGDVYGPSQPTMFGLKDSRFEAAEIDGKVIAFPEEKFGIKVASMGFIMNRDEAAIVRGPMLAGYFSMLFEQVEWGPLDFLVFDLPPGTGDIQLTLTQKIPLNGAVIVTTPQEISIADVRRSIKMFERVNVDILGIIENMSYFVPPDMPYKKYYIFGEGGGKQIADEAGVNLLGQVPLDIAMRMGNDGGTPIVFSGNSLVQSTILKNITAEMVSQLRNTNYKKSQSSNLEISI